MRNPLWIAMLIASSVLLHHEAMAFGSGVHNDLTVKVLLPLGFSPTAAAQIGDANQFIDGKEANNPPTHVDSESFEAASELMRTRLRLSVSYLINGDVTKARETFGYLTHTAQDFYAHTNYVEYMSGDPIDLLHLTNPSSTVSCSSGNMKNGLTSGYYPDASAPSNKCSHAQLSKDGREWKEKHYSALHYAKKETEHMVDEFKRELQSQTGNERQAGSLLNDFIDGDHAADQYNTFRNETARAMVKVYPSPQRRGDDVTVVFTADQACEEFQVDVVDLSGRIIGVETSDGAGRGLVLYKGPMGENETKTLKMRTDHFAAAMYLMRAVFDRCSNGGHGNQVFKFLIL